MHGTHASLRDTRNPLSENVRTQVVYLLNRTLGAAIDLQAQAKQAHWNVRGANFIALHGLFDGVAGVIAGFVDELAERVTALGGIALGTVQVAAKLSTLKPYPTEITAEKLHLEALSSALATFAHALREGIDTSDNLGDVVTADLFTGMSREIEKQLWFVESHLNA
jgi:starvation-inducible DNA-binding protein